MKILRIFTKSRTVSARQRNSRLFRPLIDGGRLEERTVPAVTPYRIPLELVNIRTSDNPEYKLGIYVGLGGGAPKLYELDTGGKGFWAAYSSKDCDCQWWGNFDLKEKGTMNITYSSGNVYRANLVSTVVTLYAPGENGQAPSPVVSSGKVDMAQITRFTNIRSSSAAPGWNNALKDGEPPLFGHFYGDFGASLEPISSNKGSNIFSILPQIPMPEGLDVGFTVHVGAIDGSTRPYLELGIDRSAGSTDTTLVNMNVYTNPSTGKPVYVPFTGVNSYSEQVVNAGFEIRDDKRNLKQTFGNVGWTIDTGAPSAAIWQAKSLKDTSGINVRRRFLKPGKTLFRDNVDLKIKVESATSGESNLEIKALTGKPYPKIPLSAGRHGGSGATGWNYVNTGLWTFTLYDVSFNLSKGQLGLKPVSTSQV